MENPKESMRPEGPMTPWAWPLDLEIYDRTPALASEEQEALATFLLPRRDRAQMVMTASQQEN